MEKTVHITEKEWEMCYKVIDAFTELYEMEELNTYTDSKSLFEVFGTNGSI